MSEIILPEGASSQDNDQDADTFMEEINYEPTQLDELTFLLCYHMKLQPSEVEKMDVEKRKWFWARFNYQKHSEQEMFQRMKLMEKIGGTIKG